MRKFTTLPLSDPLFETFVWGTFSDQERALPVPTLNSFTAHHQTTFEIQRADQIATPPFFRKWAQIFKLNRGLLPAVTVLHILARAEAEHLVWNPLLASISLVGLICLVVGMSLRLDFNDHLSSWDRMTSVGQNLRPLQKGWTTAIATKNWSLFYLLAGAFCGLPVLVLGDASLIVIALLTVASVVVVSFQKLGRHYRLVSEVSVFLLMGPLLSVGFAAAIGLPLSGWILAQGILVGWFAALLVHLKSYSQLMVSSQLRLTNSMTIMGFEKGNLLLQFWLLVFAVMLVLDHLIFGQLHWALTFAFVGTVLTGIGIRSLRRIRSPLGSNFNRTLRQVRQLGFVLIAIWILESVGYLLLADLQ